MLQKLNIVPRWLIFAIDLVICSFAYLLTALITAQFALSAIPFSSLLADSLIVLAVNVLVFYQLRTHAGIIRYTGPQDALRIFYAVLIANTILSLLSLAAFQVWGTGLSSSILDLAIYSVLSFVLLVAYRVSIKLIFSYARSYKLNRKQVVIYGAGEAGFATRRVLAHDAKSNVSILAFLDDHPKKAGKVVDGIPIHLSSDLVRLAQNHQIDELIIATFSLSITQKNKLVDLCLDLGIKVLSVPPFEKWIDGAFSTRQLQTIKIENLLEREPIKINNKLIADQISDKRILVTGAAGSIGSEIVRQLIKFKPESIILLDQAETPLHQLELELQELKHSVKCIPFLGDVRNEQRMEELFSAFEPHYVYHAAAYKHVPMMELCPSEAILTNVGGTKIIADLAVKYQVQRFVMVSTDKAVNPTNVMGASKRLAEAYIQSLHQASLNKLPKFITTRFGNVLGSNGSVINRFKEQIQKGGPLTVTHPEITRYFMTIPEACQLVLEAGSMGKGGEIFVFDMGQAVRITDLANKMIRLYGLIPDRDIAIEYTGLRPGEKLFEELLNDAENTLPTYHEKIMIARIREEQTKNIKVHLEELFQLALSPQSSMQMVAKMKALVPEFVSNNSVFEALDGEQEEQKVISIKRVG